MKPTEITVSIPFVKVDFSQNPNMRANNTDESVSSYMKSLVVAFSSVRRFNPGARLQLITNEAPGKPYDAQLSGLGVEVRQRAFEHSPPPGFALRFAASLYLLDALETLQAGTTVMIDPDVLCISPLDALIEALDGSIGALPIDYGVDDEVNGISRRAAGELHSLLGEDRPCPVHFGGEVYVFSERFLDKLKSRSEAAWQLSLSRYSAGLSRFHTEEHILSYALAGVPTETIELYTRRIWTAHRLRQVDGKESELVLWHLPAEKNRGFARLYSDAVDKNSWFWSASDSYFVARAGRLMGLHHRSPVRYMLDLAGRTVHVARKALRDV